MSVQRTPKEFFIEAASGLLNCDRRENRVFQHYRREADIGLRTLSERLAHPQFQSAWCKSFFGRAITPPSAVWSTSITTLSIAPVKALGGS